MTQYPDEPRSDPAYAALRFEIFQRVLRGESEEEIADLLEVERERFPDMAGELSREIESYRR